MALFDIRSSSTPAASAEAESPTSSAEGYPPMSERLRASRVTETLTMADIDTILRRTFSVLDRTVPANPDHHRVCLISGYLGLLMQVDHQRLGQAHTVDEVYQALLQHLEMVELLLSGAAVASGSA